MRAGVAVEPYIVRGDSMAASALSRVRCEARRVLLSAAERQVTVSDGNLVHMITTGSPASQLSTWHST